MKDFNCHICDDIINHNTLGHPYIKYQNKPICYNCGMGITEETYYTAGYGDGGLIHYLFHDLIKSNHNRKKRRSLKANKQLFNKLLVKYNFKCVYCGEKENSKLTIDHKKPVSLGGSDKFTNLQILCKSCNSRKSNKWIDKE